MILLRRSSKARNHLRRYTTLAPVVDVKTRWSSTYKMLARFLKLENPLKKAAMDDDQISERLNFIQDPETMLSINSLVDLLGPFQNATNKLSEKGINLTTADLIFEQLLSNLNYEPVKNLLLKRIHQRRKTWSDILLNLTKLHHSVSFYSKPTKNDIISLCKLLTPDNSLTAIENYHGQHAKSADNVNDLIEASKKLSESVSEGVDSIEIEVDRFLKDVRTRLRLKMLTEALLSIQPTSIDSERSFSICGMILTQRRIRLSPDKICILLFINQNFSLLK